MTFGEYLDLLNKEHRQHPDWRAGQTYYNYLPLDLKNMVLGTNLDPFYNDDRIPAFLEFIADKFGQPKIESRTAEFEKGWGAGYKTGYGDGYDDALAGNDYCDGL